jgi:hypothetical protein
MIPKLLFDICNCSNFNEVIQDKDVRNCCSQVVSFQERQGVTNKANFYIPEPWSGDIVNAPILFISSNPGYANGELYPLHLWNNPIKADYFINRFKDRGNGYSWVYKNRLLRRDGIQGKSVNYWSSIKKRAEELLGREAIPGKDYCNTELVHCKSTDQIGVNSALSVCTKRFINEKISICGAKIIVGIGSFVKNYFKGILVINEIPVIYLPHPNAFEPKTFKNKYSELEIQRIRNIINTEVSPKTKISVCDFGMPSDEEVIQFMEEQFISNKYDQKFNK